MFVGGPRCKIRPRLGQEIELRQDEKHKKQKCGYPWKQKAAKYGLL
jgi:hypothetical protein